MATSTHRFEDLNWNSVDNPPNHGQLVFLDMAGYLDGQDPEELGIDYPIEGYPEIAMGYFTNSSDEYFPEMWTVVDECGNALLCSLDEEVGDIPYVPKRWAAIPA